MNRELVDALNRALADEISDIIKYQNQAYMVLGPSRDATYEAFENIAKGEMKHMEKLSKRIVGLGGTPTVNAKNIEQTNVIEDMLKMDADDERNGIASYKKIRDIAKKDNELATVKLIEDIIQDEQDHLDEINKMLRRNPA